MPRRPLLASCLALSLVATTAGSALAHDVVAPRPKSQPAAAWPGGKADTHDVVVPVVVTVSEEGKVASAEIEASVSPELDRAALEAVRAWTFEPALRDGKPVAARIRSAVRFLGVAAPAAPAAAPVQEAPATPPPAAVVAPAPGAPPPEEPKHEHVEHVRVEGAAPPRSASEVRRERDVIGAAPHRTASDALQVVPGVFVTQHSGEGKAHQIFLRGFDAVHGQDIELWVGGVPVNEVSNVHGQGYADLHFAMPEVLKEIRATPGTYDPRQGDFGVAGTIRMKLGYAEPGATAKATYGSFGTKRLFLAYHPKEMSDETFAAFEEYSTDGFGPNRAARRGSFVAQATHDFSDGLSVRVLGSTYSGRYDAAGVVPEADIARGKVDRFAVLDPKQGGHSTRHQVLAELHRDSEKSRFEVAPFVVFRNLQLRQNFTGYFLDTQRGGKPTLDSDNTQQLNQSTTLGMTASFQRTLTLLAPHDSIEVGFYGRHDIIEQSQRRLSEVDDHPTETLVDAKVRGTDLAGYADLAVHPIRRLTVRGGVRADVLSYSAEDQAVGGTTDPTRQVAAQGRAAQGAHLGKKLTVDYAIVPGLHALASYGEGFRSPQARSLSDGEKTFFTEVTSTELGLRYQDGKRFAGSIAAFYTDLTEDLVFDPATARNERVPGTRRVGGSAELTARTEGGLVASASATYTHASFTGSNDRYGEGDLLPYVPQLVLRSDVTYKRALTQVLGRTLEGRVGGGMEGLAGRPLPYGDYGQNVFLVDASAGLRLKEVELGLDVFNLLDRKWYDGQFVYASNFGKSATPRLVPFQHVSVGPPRTVLLSLSIHI